MISNVFFRVYKRISDIRHDIKLSYYKHLWKEQFECTSDFKIDSSVNIDIQSGEAKVIFAAGVSFRRFCNILCSAKGILTIGKNVFFNNYCSVSCLDSISIGNDTIFGEGVKLYDHNHVFVDKNKLVREQGMKYGAIEIGSNCWIGSNTIILPGVTIGDNVVIGANNLVFKSIPANTIIMAKAEKLLREY